MDDAKTSSTVHRRTELTARLPVLLACLVDAISDDAGDNPATAVLAAVALEHARELSEMEGVHGQA